MANPARKLYRGAVCKACGRAYVSIVPVCPDCGNVQEFEPLTPIHIGPRRGLAVWKKAEKLLEADMNKRGISNYRCSKATGGVPEITYKNGSKFNCGPTRNKLVAGPPGINAAEYANLIPSNIPAGKITWTGDSGPAMGAIAPPPIPVQMPAPKFRILNAG